MLVPAGALFSGIFLKHLIMFNLIEHLETYVAVDTQEEERRRRFLDFVRTQPDGLSRKLEVGHLTASTWLLSPNRQAVLLTHHRKLNRWLQLGGHADGEPDLAAVALREAHEESGIAKIYLLSDQIFDLDIHHIPAGRGVKAHLHYDVRFLAQADSWQFKKNTESYELRWFNPGEIAAVSTEESLLRMERKWVRLSQPSVLSL